ncbi:hypothetical protein V5O48_018802 [Marasmius crinis-equi]|uniref:Uncharacterized protein n=1 Tax=Marasmius crinis-equi TaxID=585013 RepID=A0ABR3EKA5_9AGAR
MPAPNTPSENLLLPSSRFLNYLRSRYDYITQHLKADTPRETIQDYLCEIVRTLEYPSGFKLLARDAVVLEVLRKCLAKAIPLHAKLYRGNAPATLYERKFLVQTAMLCDYWNRYHLENVSSSMLSFAPIHVPLNYSQSRMATYVPSCLEDVLIDFNEEFDENAIARWCQDIGI